MPLFCWRPWSSGRLIAVIGFLALLAMVFTSAHARAAVGDTAVGDDDASVAYTGAWTYQLCSGYYTYDCHFSNTPGNVVTVRFNGTAVSWIGSKNVDHGKADVRICDGSGANCGSATTVDTYASSHLLQQVLFSTSGLSAGYHTLQITLRSDKNPGSSGTYQDVDEFTYTPSTLTGTYYVNNMAGSNCNDANAGTSTAAPWCDFANVSSSTFGAGAQILLARGSTWNQRVDLYGSGTSASHITFGAYGSGANPHLQRNSAASDRVMWMHDPSDWNVQDLEVSNAGAGIVAFYTTNLHEGLNFTRLYIHDIRGVFAASPGQNDLPGMYHSAGLLITGNVPVTASDYAVQNVNVSNIEGANDNDDFDISGFNYSPGGQQGFLTTVLGHHSVQNVTLKNAYFHGAQSGENFDDLQHMTILDTRLDGMGSGGNSAGTTMLFYWSSTDVNFVNGILRNEANTGSFDQTGSDLEAYDDQIKYRGSYIGDNAGAGIELLQINGDPNNYSTNTEVSSNAFSNDSTSGPSTGSLWLVASTTVPNGTIQNNLYYEPTWFIGVQSGSFSPFTFTNNQSINSAADLYAAGRDFSSVQNQNQWQYQHYNGTSWSQISSFDSTNQRWGTSTNYVDRFDTLPDACSSCWTARAWTAPKTGTIQIRGWVLKNDISGGDGVRVRITKNGTVIWPTGGGSQSIASNDQVGFATNVGSIPVATGDVIRFEVNSGSSGDASGDLTSWSPSVGYFTPTNRVNDNDSSVTYSGSWTYTNCAGGYYLGECHYSQTNGDVATFAFIGTSVTWIGSKNTDHGIASVQVCDGAGANCTTATNVDTYASTHLTQQTLYTASGLTLGAHQLKITVTNSKNVQSSGFFQDVDAFDNTRLINDTDSSIAYTGTWTYQTCTGYYSGDCHFSGTNGSVATIAFAGTSVTWIGAKNVDHGIASVQVCDVNGANCGTATNVDTYASSYLKQQALYTASGLTAGGHTLKITVTNTKNAQSSGFYQDIDGVEMSG
jgi:hypothetical protein